jgi:catechol 2,3-dioxygenase-like lactoylglutathione lyase family enzyme
MFDHIGITVTDLARSIRFYRDALAPLGLSLTAGGPEEGYAGFGRGTDTQLWLGAGKPTQALHLALKAPSRDAVAGFHQAALATGGKDNGAPGPRPNYSPGYYAAFVLDPDGNNIEAVLHEA